VTSEKTAEQRSFPSTSQKWLTCDGRQLGELTQAALAHLDENHRLVNELNVFPVPDGDTGTNMLLTMRAAVRRIQDSEDKHVGHIAHEISHGALMGARGNSGVILSQIWRGLARGLQGKATFNAADLAAALQESADTAYKGVMRPVEGTILTVIREGAAEAQDAIRKSQDLRFVLERVLERTQQALARTPELLPVLKQAGVVDAGGQGLVFILEGMLLHVHGHIRREAALVEEAYVPAQARAAPAGGLENPYDVQYILLGDNLDVLKVREDIDRMGDSTVVVGDEKAIKVHIHVKDPGVPISYGIGLGRIADVVIENMQMQMEEIIGGPPQTPAFAAAPELELEPGQIGVVAVASGDGLAAVFRSLGASGIVNGGQSNNPSTEEIYEVVNQISADRVVILPNNKNIILAAEAASHLCDKEVAVVPTRTVPQGVSALLALNRDGDLKQTVEAMMAAARHVVSGEIAVATRSVVLDDVAVAEGQIIGVVNGRLRAASSNMNKVIRQVMEEMALADRELVTIYYGDDVQAMDAEVLAEQIQELYPDVEVEVVAGGQAIYQYILGAE
jgi:uncharacterized protein